MAKVTVIEPVIQRLSIDSNSFQPKKLRVAAYARVSTEQDEQQNSYEVQVKYYTHFIESNPDWEFKGVYADEGISGTNTRKRDGFNRMMEAALNGEIEISLPKWIQSHKSETVLKSLEIRHFTAFATSSAAFGEGRFSVLCG